MRRKIIITKHPYESMFDVAFIDENGDIYSGFHSKEVPVFNDEDKSWLFKEDIR